MISTESSGDSVLNRQAELREKGINVFPQSEGVLESTCGTAVAHGEHSCCSWQAGTRHGMLGEMPVALGEASPWPCPPGSQGADAEPWPGTS